MSWDAAFDEPIALPSGRRLRTLRDAGEYVASLPKALHEVERWRTAISVLIATAEGGPVMIAHIAMRRAIDPPAEPIYNSKRKTTWTKATQRQGVLHFVGKRTDGLYSVAKMLALLETGRG